ncbi:CHRD domain-containing protein [Pseudanabaena sp. PCC 6802]|uniref:CHRD domain-containing protein n=1 Tax=Pseudanabaena sp. PCC 6802 TaxID=118173 RepID=UPI00034B0D1D|nr:CHRD domain-containing protein [Pseudanabaena sp. PCC 6802]
MNIKKLALNFLLGLIACIGLASVPMPSLSTNLPARNLAIDLGTGQPTSLEPRFPMLDALNSQQEAARVLLAQNPGMTFRQFTAVMTGKKVVPSPAETSAWGSVGAVLSSDNRLIVRGQFSNLSSPLRDYATDPATPPNPNVTTAIHIHKGMANQNGPFQYALTVTLDADNLSGKISGEYTLTPEQLQALDNGMLYVDLHTKGNRGGELRGILKAA